MDALETIKAEWFIEMGKLQNSFWFQKFARGDMKIDHYKSFLRETYFNARENPQLQAFATAFFRGEQRKLIKRFYQHAISEIGHDAMALNDLSALGVDTSDIPNQRPLPTTTGFTAFGFYQVQFLSCLGYLGYLFHLEFMPTQNGRTYIERLSGMGVPMEALTFLEEHSTVDIHHNKLMEGYLRELIKTKSDLEEVVWATKTACVLHGQMVIGAFEAVV